MRRAPTPLDTFEACFIAGRGDPRGVEDGKSRPWLVLSRPDTHAHHVFLGCSITSARVRAERGYLLEGVTFVPPFPDVQDPSKPRAHPTHLDTQQLWTFPLEQDCTWCTHGLAAAHVSDLELRLCERLSPTPEPLSPREFYSVGRIVWVELLAGHNITRSDLAALRKVLVAANVRWDYRDQRLPAIVVATTIVEERSGAAPLPLITVVPLLDVPALLADPDTPRVRVRGIVDWETNLREFAALARLLLTVDRRARPVGYVENAAGDLVLHRFDRRVHSQSADGTVSTWIATPAEVRTILNDVRRTIGLPGLSPDTTPQDVEETSHEPA